MTRQLLLVVAAALIDDRGCLLLAKRPQGKSMAGLWEFPGGKIEAGETPEQALSRELREELAIEAQAFEPLTFASHPYEKFHLLMPLFACRAWSGVPAAIEHEALAWAAPSELAAYPMPPADAPLAAFLARFLR